jgi:CRP-like cAMP-binding protein
MAGREELIDSIAGFGLFADTSGPQLEGIAHVLEEVVFGEGERILRQGVTGSGFYIIVEGQVAVLVDGVERARLGRGEFFGEVSALLGDPPIADIVAMTVVRCLVLPGHAVEGFLLANPQVMYRMLQAQARRLRAANRWGS